MTLPHEAIQRRAAQLHERREHDAVINTAEQAIIRAQAHEAAGKVGGMNVHEFKGEVAMLEMAVARIRDHGLPENITFSQLKERNEKIHKAVTWSLVKLAHCGVQT